MMTRKTDVCLIGAGWAGIYATKYLVHAGFDCLCLDERKQIGGLWNPGRKTSLVAVPSFTWTSTPKAYTEATDYPWPDGAGYYISAHTLHRWLENYVDNFGIRERFALGVRVLHVGKHNAHGDEAASWVIQAEVLESSQKFEVHSKFLVVATGLNHEKVDLRNTEKFKNFNGRFVHSSEIHDLDQDMELFRNKVVVAYGGGENATDLAYYVSRFAKAFYMCVPRGQWMQNRSFLSRHWPLPELPKAPTFENYGHSAIPWEYQNTPFRMLFRPMWAFSGWNPLFLETLNGVAGTGMEAWRPTSPIYRSFGNKADLIHHAIADGRVIAKRDIQWVADSTVCFTDNTSIDADVILMATGFKSGLPFFPDRIDIQARSLYHQCIDVNDPSLAFIGYVRPVQGSIPQMVEMQCNYITALWKEDIPCPPYEERRASQQEEKAHWDCYFRFTSNRVKGLVDGWLYMRGLATELKWNFSIVRVLCRFGPKIAWKTLWSPSSMHMFFAGHPDKESIFLDHVNRRMWKQMMVPNILLVPYDIMIYPIRWLQWSFRERFVPFFRDPMPEGMRGKFSKYEQFWLLYAWAVAVLLSLLGLAIGLFVPEIIKVWAAIIVLGVGYNLGAVNLFKAMRIGQELRKQGIDPDSNPEARRIMLPKAVYALAPIAAGWISAITLLIW